MRSSLKVFNKQSGITISAAALSLAAPVLAQVPTTQSSADPTIQKQPTSVETQIDTTVPSPSAPVATPTVGQDQNSGLSDIVVTAQRRSERLQNVPIAISAFNEQQLAVSGVTTTRDLQQVTSGLNFVQSAYAPQPTIRGIGTRNSNPGDEQVVPVYLDGVYQPFIVGGIFELNNVERIEVLKGPQGTLLGRNATGGAINIITLKPTTEVSGKLAVGYGSYDEKQISGYISGGSGPIAGSISAQFLDDDGFVRNAITGARTSAVRNVMVRSKLLIQPSSSTEILLTASYSKRDDTTSVGYPLNGNTAARAVDPNVLIADSNRRISNSFDPFLYIKQKALSGTITQRLGFADLTSVTGYSRNLLNFTADIDLTALPINKLAQRQFENAFSEDLFLSSTSDGPLNWTVGTFYFDDKSGYEPRINSARSATGVVTAPVVTTRNNTKAYAFYAQAGHKLTNQLTATIGGRYSNDRKCASAAQNGVVRLAKTCETWDSFDPSATLDYAITKNTKVFARYAQAFKSGLFNNTSFLATPVSPEKVKSYELGVKSDPLPWLRLNVSGYYTDYKNIQVNARDPISQAVVLQNAAAARIYGIEGDLILNPIERLNVRLGGAAISAEYKTFLNAQILTPRPTGGNVTSFIDASGLNLVRTPQTSLNGSVDYTFDGLGGRLTPSANAFHQSSLNWTLDGQVKTRAFTMINAQLAWRSLNDHVEIAIWGKNLTNVDSPESVVVNAVADQAQYRRPRTFGARGSYRF